VPQNLRRGEPPQVVFAVPLEEGMSSVHRLSAASSTGVASPAPPAGGARESLYIFYHDYRHLLDVVGVFQALNFNEQFPESDKIQLHQNNIMAPLVYKAQRLCQILF